MIGKIKSSQDLAKAFLNWRKDNGISLRVAADEIDCSNAFLSQFERGKIKDIGYNKALTILNLMNKPVTKSTKIIGKLK